MDRRLRVVIDALQILNIPVCKICPWISSSKYVDELLLSASLQTGEIMNHEEHEVKLLPPRRPEFSVILFVGVRVSEKFRCRAHDVGVIVIDTN